MCFGFLNELNRRNYYLYYSHNLTIMKKCILLIVLLFAFLYSCEDESDDGLSEVDTGSKNTTSYSLSDDVSHETSSERYNEYEDNPFILSSEQNVSIFSVDAYGGSYANVRKYINSGSLPSASAVRIEEFLNYFNYEYDEPSGEYPIAVNGEVRVCPWETSHDLIRIGIKGETLSREEIGASNLVLLIDVSGSMSDESKLPLLQESFCLLVDEFTEDDRVAIVTYSGNAGIALESTSGSEKKTLKMQSIALNPSEALQVQKGLSQHTKLQKPILSQMATTGLSLLLTGIFM